MAREISKNHRAWLQSLGKKGQKHNDNNIRIVTLPPYKTDWDISEYENRWDLIDQKLAE